MTWEKNGTRLQTGENKCFTIASVQSGHFGDYTCVGTDGKTTIGPFVLSLVEKEEPGKLQLCSDACKLVQGYQYSICLWTCNLIASKCIVACFTVK